MLSIILYYVRLYDTIFIILCYTMFYDDTCYYLLFLSCIIYIYRVASQQQPSTPVFCQVSYQCYHHNGANKPVSSWDCFEPTLRRASNDVWNIRFY